ncbi:MAG: 50S ribosomal protein L6 [Minisyncoccales bacterium]
MSRVGKKPILIPAGVEVKIDGQKVVVKGPRGELFKIIHPEIRVETKDNQIFTSSLLDLTKGKDNKTLTGRQIKKIKALWGLSRVLIANMIKGVTEGFEKKLEISGIGFKAEVSGNELILSVGFSHPIKLKIPAGLQVSVVKNIITVSGVDKELVGQFAAVVRKVKLAEPYKGKGIKYVGEVIRRKVGKKAAAVAGK